MLARFLLVVGVVVMAVVAAPTEEKGRSASSLPAEHRQPSTQAQTPHPIEDIMDA